MNDPHQSVTLSLVSVMFEINQVVDEDKGVFDVACVKI